MPAHRSPATLLCQKAVVFGRFHNDYVHSILHSTPYRILARRSGVTFSRTELSACLYYPWDIALVERFVTNCESELDLSADVGASYWIRLVGILEINWNITLIYNITIAVAMTPPCSMYGNSRSLNSR